jgi:imidazoleglycerol phosphate dehydratase HisB
MKRRTARIERKTGETDVQVLLNLDGQGQAQISTGLGFLDHMIETLARHARFDLTLNCQGDLRVDDHHTTEDCALAIGQAIDQALGDRRGITRFGWAYAPLDESLARGCVDLSGRPFVEVEIGLKGEKVGELVAENIAHFVNSLAMTSRSTIHVNVLKGINDHHRAEAAFKALALALRQAVSVDGGRSVPSTKGVL